MTEKKSINYDFKFLYAIGMILVVAGHCSNGRVSIFYDWFTPYAFLLPMLGHSTEKLEPVVSTDRISMAGLSDM